jgi:2-oxoglutarate dehydrogenase E1 component
MGAWGYLRLRFGNKLANRHLKVVARAASASPATGSASAHRLEQQQVIDRALSAD